MSNKAQTHNVAEIEELKTSNLFSVKDIVAVVTGGGTGIGMMIAKALAVNGAKVYIVGRREEALKKTAEEHDHESMPGSIIPLPGDVTTKESIQKLADYVKEKEGYINLLVNNAGISGPKHDKEELDKKRDDASHLSQGLWSQDFSEWTDVYTTNVSALYFTAVAFLPLLQEGTRKKDGYSSSIVNISSMSGFVKDSQSHMAYNSSKAAAVHLTRMMAWEFRSLKIRVNTIAPGLFPSEMTAGESDDRNISVLEKQMDIPAGRPGKASEMAGAILLLASEAGLYYNGIVLPIDGGYMLVNPAAY